MSNIVKFPNSGQSIPDRGVPVDVERPSVERRSHWSLRALPMLLTVVRVPVFLVLYWLRTPVVLICSFLSFPMFLLCLFAWYAFPEKPQMYWSFGVVSFAAFVVMFAYDLLLVWLSPQEMVRTL